MQQQDVARCHCTLQRWQAVLASNHTAAKAVTHTRKRLKEALELTEEGEVDEREVVEQQEPEEFACRQHEFSAAAAHIK